MTTKLLFQRPLGAGAFGKVYLAKLILSPQHKRNVAVKLLTTDKPSMEGFRQRVRDEAKLLQLIVDEEILQVHGLVKVGNLDGILMEFVDGIDLSDAIHHKQRLSPRAIAQLGAACARALGRAHQAVHPQDNSPLLVIHRDIKPANIMITNTGTIKICDFGVARARFQMRESYTNPKDVLGTLDYMDPDYIVSGQLSNSADVYGLGLCLLECVTQQQFGTPKLRQDEHDRQLLRQLNLIPRNLHALRRIIHRMLLWNPQERFTAEQAAQMFNQHLDSLPGESLATWANQNVQTLQNNQAKITDSLTLQGKSFVIEYDEKQPAGSKSPYPIESTPTNYASLLAGTAAGCIAGFILYLVVCSVFIL